jgi:putative flippase GtrA
MDLSRERLLRVAKQFSVFVIIGGINTAIDFCVLNIEIKITGITSGSGLFVLNTISFLVAVINSYFMNKYWTFQDVVRKQEETKFAQFIAVSLVGSGINSSIVAGITTYIDPVFGVSLILWANIAKLLATGVSLIWNFIGYKLFVFKK